MPTTYIIGHQKPDTDSVVAAMALEYLYKKATCFDYAHPKAVIADPVNSETKYLLDRFGVKAPQILRASDVKPDDQFVLVDHNETTQRHSAITDDQVVEIVDHHKANLNFGKPIYLTFKTWGSSCTIVNYVMQQCSVQPDTTLAGLMLAAILSDTVGLKSPTSTKHDRDAVTRLAQLASIKDLDGFTLEIFKAKSDISRLSAEQIVKNDYKIFEFAKPTYIGQIETVEQQLLLDQKKDELITAMKIVKKEMGVEYLFLAVTDILQINTKLLILDKDEALIAQKAFGGRVVDSVLDIGAKLSRKKEIAPAIETAVASC
ncbi:MAG TPA: manganese-dependent inorganic pyrophosphatase [Candidatus Woesebacteria bacterium]|nr:manganese-dependent inorganic pyrophosphatase [Candidatus Woesebacteria bacterium]